MYSLNKAQIIGNVTADPEVRQTPNGTYVANISVATNRRFTDSAGIQQDIPEFHNIVLWSKLAEITEQYVKKGQKVYIEGRLQTRSWEDQSGAKKYKTEIVAENLIMLSSKSDSAGMGSSPKMDIPTEAPTTKKSQPAPEEQINPEDIPF